MSDGDIKSCDPFEDEDWSDLEKPSHGGAQKPVVTVTLSVWRGRHTRALNEPPRVRARVVLRREAAEWIAAHEPRFRVQIGGAGCNLLRIVADAARGSYEAAEIKGVRVISLGVVNVWPNETRREIEARFRVTEGGARPHSAGGFREARSGRSGGDGRARCRRSADSACGRRCAGAAGETSRARHARRAAAGAQRARSAAGR
ncbi:hypothetical+protein [Methylocapsa aurea]|uniref:hypothetical protein n=1 Tax=Methylocapsa aurea TaxID=663610 RepID=UPI003D189736